MSPSLTALLKKKEDTEGKGTRALELAEHAEWLRIGYPESTLLKIAGIRRKGDLASRELVLGDFLSRGRNAALEKGLLPASD